MLLLAIVLPNPTARHPESGFLQLSLILVGLATSARAILRLTGCWEARPLFQGFCPRQRS